MKTVVEVFSRNNNEVETIVDQIIQKIIFFYKPCRFYLFKRFQLMKEIPH